MPDWLSPDPVVEDSSPSQGASKGWVSPDPAVEEKPQTSGAWVSPDPVFRPFADRVAERQQIRDNTLRTSTVMHDMVGHDTPVADLIYADEQADKAVPFTPEERQLEIQHLHHTLPYNAITPIKDEAHLPIWTGIGLAQRGTSALLDKHQKAGDVVYDALSTAAWGGMKLVQGLGSLATLVGQPGGDAISYMRGLDPTQDEWGPTRLRLKWNQMMDDAEKHVVPPSASNAGFDYQHSTLNVGDPELVPDGLMSATGLARAGGSTLGMMLGGGVLGELGGAIVKGLSLGAEATPAVTHATHAAIWTLSSIGNVQNEVTQAAKAKGADEITADRTGTVAAAMYAPVAYWLNFNFNPAVKMMSGTKFADSFYGSMVRSSFEMGAFSGLDTSGLEAVEWLTKTLPLRQNKDGTFRNSTLWDVAGDVGRATGHGMVSGLMLGGFDGVGRLWRPAEKYAFLEQLNADFGLDQDAFRRIDLKHEALKFGVGSERADTWVELFDALAGKKAADEGKPREQVYGEIWANQNERDRSQAQITFNQTDKVSGFYSKLDKLTYSGQYVASFGEKPADPAAVLAFLRQQGAKEAELRDTGMIDFLTKRDGRVSREEIRDYLKDNLIQIQTMVKTDTSGERRKELEELRAKRDDLQKQRQEHLTRLNEMPTEFQKTTDPAKKQQLNQEANSRSDGLKDIDKQLNVLEDQIYTISVRPAKEGDAEYPSNTLSGPSTNYEEWLMRVPLVKRNERGEPISDMNELVFDERTGGDRKVTPDRVFTSGHWDESNVFVHIRLDRRMTDKGSTMFINEIQSDWHQKGRDIGYKESKENTELQDTLARRKLELTHQLVGLQDTFDELVEERTSIVNDLKLKVPPTKENLPIYGAYATVIKAIREHLGEEKATAFSDLTVKIDGIRTKKSDLQEQENKNDQGREDAAHPPIGGPFSDNWTEIALKKILLEAVARGEDRVTFASGEMQDMFQGVHSAEKSEKRKKFYEEVIPSTLLKIVRKFDKSAKMEVVKVPTGLNLEGRTQLVDSLGILAQRLETVKDFSAVELVNETKGLYARGNLSEEDLLLKLRQIQPASYRVVQDDLAHIDQLVKSLPGEKPALSLKLSDSVKSKLAEEGLPLYQSNKASVSFFSNMHAMLTSLKNPDFSSLIHELGHVIRRSFMTNEDLAQLEAVLDVRNGVWTREKEELFARSVERYFRGGRKAEVISAELKPFVEKTSEYLKEIYKKIDGSDINVPMNEEFRQVMENLFYEQRQPVIAQRAEVQDLESFVDLTKKEFEKLRGQAPDPKATPQDLLKRDAALLAKDKELTTGKMELAKARDRLREIKLQQYYPGEKNLAEKRFAEMTALNYLRSLPPKEYEGLMNSQPVRRISSLFKSSIDQLGNTQARRLIQEKADDHQVFFNGLVGRFDRAIKDMFYGPSKERRELSLDKTSPSWQSATRENFDELSAKTPRDKTQLSKAVQDMGKMYRIMYDVFSNALIQNSVLRKLPSGDFVSNKYREELTIPRLLTPEGWKIMKGYGGEAWRKFVEKTVELNKDHNPGMTFEQAEVDLTKSFEAATTRNVGSVEGSRSIKYLPDYVLLDSGQRINVFHTDPAEIARKWVEHTARRLGIIKYFGQGVLKDYAERPGVLRKVLRAVGFKTEYNKVQLADQLVQSNLLTQQEAAALSKAQLAKMSKDMDLPLGPTPEELLGMVHSLSSYDVQRIAETPKNSPERAEKELRRIASKLRGIDSQADLDVVMAGIKHRVTEHVMDDVISAYASLHKHEGGNPEDVKQIFRDLQGIPRDVLESTPLGRAAETGMNVVGTMHTSLSPVKNAFQTATTLTSEAGVEGLVKAYAQVARNYHGELKEAIDLGAFRSTIYQGWASDTSFGLLKLGRLLKENVGRVLQTRTAEFNNLVAAVVGKNLANKWRGGGFGRGDEIQARRMRLNDAEIAEIKSGQMSDHTYAKIVQNMVATTQYVTEGPHRKAGIELNPWTKAVFAYTSYAFGRSRQVADMVHGMQDAVKSRDPVAIYKASRPIMLTLASAVGVGVLQSALIQAMKGRPVVVGDDWWDTVTGALFETQVLGYATQLATPLESPNTTANYAMSLVPLVNFANQFVKTTFGLGRYGQFDLGKRWLEFFKSQTPAATMIDKNLTYFKYPERQRYDEARALLSRWERNQPGYVSKPTGDNPLNPDYYPVFEALANNQYREAQQLTHAYVHKVIQMSKEQQRDPDEFMAAMKQSLLAKSPINLSEEKMFKFLKSLPPEKRQQILRLDVRYKAMVDGLF